MRYKKTHRKNLLNSISLFFLIATIAALGFGIKYFTSSPKAENLPDKELDFIQFGKPNSPSESQIN